MTLLLLRYNLARRMMDLIPPETLYDTEAVKFRFDLIETREHYDALEARCRQALREAPKKIRRRESRKTPIAARDEQSAELTV